MALAERNRGAEIRHDHAALMATQYGRLARRVGLRRLIAEVVDGQSRRLIFAVLLNCLHQVLDVLIPVLVGLVVSEVLEARGAFVVGSTVAAVLLVFGLRSLSYRFGYRLSQRAQVLSGERLRLSIIRQLLYAKRDRPVLPGSVASVVNADTNRISIVGFALPQMISTVLGLLLVCGFLVSISPWLCAAMVAAGAVAVAVLSVATRLVARTAGADRRANILETSLAEDACRGMRVIRGIGAARAVGDRYRQVSAEARDAAIRSAVAEAGHRGLSVAVGGIVLAVGVGVGAWLMVRGELTAGEFVATLGLLQFIQGAMTGLGWSLSVFSQAIASILNVVELTGEEPGASTEPVGAHTPDGPAAVELVLENVSVGGVTGLNCRLRPGEVVGVVATDQRVTSELFECLEGRRAVRAGRILVGGVDVGERGVDVRRSPGTGLVTVVDNQAGLIADTFREDLDLLSDSADTLADAVSATLTDEVLPELAARATQPGAQTTQVVSGGELQRLALLRALVARPAVLAMRDATTALDPASEQHVMRSLVRLRTGGVTVLSTTSPIALAATTRILLLDGAGRPVEGTHHDLLRKSDRYREIVWGAW